LQQLVHQYHGCLGFSAPLEDGVGASKEYGAMQALERGRWEDSLGNYLEEHFEGVSPLLVPFLEREATVKKNFLEKMSDENYLDVVYMCIPTLKLGTCSLTFYPRPVRILYTVRVRYGASVPVG
jgi:hypothetical protein